MYRFESFQNVNSSICCVVQHCRPGAHLNQVVFDQQINIGIYGSEVEISLINYPGFACSIYTYIQNLRGVQIGACLDFASHPLP